MRTRMVASLCLSFLWALLSLGHDPSPPPSSPKLGNGSSTLVLYDDGGPYGWLGELYAMSAGQLASHFGTWKAEPVSQYQAGELSKATATIYIGSTYDQPIPTAFLDDVMVGTKPVIWIRDNIWQLGHHQAEFARQYGLGDPLFDKSPVSEVRYKGKALTRCVSNEAGIMVFRSLDPHKAQVLATAVRADGSTFPWAVRSRNLTYIGENPFAYTSESDRYLAFCDLLFDALAPKTPERHRALVRIEDVTPTGDPKALMAIADYLSSEDIPFSVGVVPVHTDPNGAQYGGIPMTLGLRNAPGLAQALRYMVKKGGTLVLHGYTHQYAKAKNPYSGVSVDDFEFWSAHIDKENNVVLDGPVPEDSTDWAADRITNALDEFRAAGLPRPRIFEFPHYIGSGVDARAISARFKTAYHRGLYFKGALTGLPEDTTHSIGQFFPYPVTDIYGWKVVPENLGNYAPDAINNHPPELTAELIANAHANLVVRDGVASFFFHPRYPLAVLQKIVAGIKQEGYTFVDPSTL